MKKIISFALAIVLGFSSCDKYLDVNKNPNYPEEVEAYLVLPAAQASVANVYSAYYSVFGSFLVQHWAQNNTSSQYKSFETYTLSGSDGIANASYRELYSGGLSDNEIILQNALQTENWGLYLMSITLKAYAFQYLVDLYDNVPYFEAFKGAEGVFNPKIDKGEDIYKDLYAKLEEALSKDFSSYSPSRYTKYDVLCGGDIDKWKQFARSLQLRLLIRESAAVNVTADLTKLMNEGGFLTTDVSLTNFEDADSKSNPLFESDQRQLNTTNNIRANAVLMYFLDANSDPRKEKLFVKVGGKYDGMVSGSYEVLSSVFEGPLHISKPNFTATMPVQLMTVAEIELLKSEAYLKLGNNAMAKTSYEAGVTASLTRLGVGSDASTLLAGPYAWNTSTNKLESIILQKWVDAADGQRGIEAFIEKNRTGYPQESAVSSKIKPGISLTANLTGSEEYVAGTLVYSKLGSTSGKYPVRLPYPDVEVNYNSNAAVYGSLKDADVIMTKVWWNK